MSKDTKVFVQTDGGTTSFEFNVRLHSRSGTTFHAFINKAYGPSVDDTVFLKQILERLLRDDTGIEMISISPYRMIITHSRAITGADLEGWLLAVARSLHKEVEVVRPD
jgi:hypothetical protein